MNLDNYIKEAKNIDGVIVIKLKGEFAVDSTPNLCNAIRALSNIQQARAILLDFIEVPKTDTAAFACLLDIIKKSINKKCRIGLINIKQKDEDLLGILRINNIIHNYKTEEEAIKDLNR